MSLKSMDQPDKPISAADKLQKTRELIFEKEAKRIRQEIEQMLQYERDSFKQSLTETELQYEQKLMELKKQIHALEQKVAELEKQNLLAIEGNIDAEKLAIILSELSLQLMSSIKNE